MPDVLTETLGGVVYDVYSDVATADEYLAADFTATTWRAETDDDQKRRALITATRLLDRQCWPGEMEDEEQGTAWPRTGVPGFEDGDVPQQIVDANSLLAKYIHEGMAIELNVSTANNVRRIKAGSVEQEYFFPLTNGTRLPLPVQELLAGLTCGGATIAAAQSFDTDRCSSADDNYGRSAPL